MNLSILTNPKFRPALFFGIGFIIDVVTLDRIDSLYSILAQGGYLLVLAVLLRLELRESWGVFQPPMFLERFWPYKNWVTHFFLGNLLSEYTLFYFKSASFLSSGVFLFIIVGLLIFNELERFHNLGPSLRLVLFALCVVSYFIYLVPVVLGFVGVTPFALALLVSALTLILFYKITKSSEIEKNILFRLRLPVLLVHLLFALLYFFRLIPPVPVAATHMGIYRDIKRENDKFLLSYSRPWWRFWEKGEQTFYYRKNDQIYGYARIFSPGQFSDTVLVRWLRKEKRGWETQDLIPIKISGGREKGFRGYTVKKFFSPGRWRFQIETTDQREISRLYFNVIEDTGENERVMTTEVDE